MISRITLMLTMLLSTAHSPFCRCCVATDPVTPESGVQVQQCPHCCDQKSQPKPCPVRPDCCCRVTRMLMLADTQGCGLETNSHHSGGELFVDDSYCDGEKVQPENSALAASPLTDRGGRALLMRTSRLRF